MNHKFPSALRRLVKLKQAHSYRFIKKDGVGINLIRKICSKISLKRLMSMKPSTSSKRGRSFRKSEENLDSRRSYK